MNKKLAYTLLSLTALGIAGCSSPVSKDIVKKEPATTQTTKETTEKSVEKQAKKDAEIILNGVLSYQSPGFNSLMGKSVSDWKKDFTDDYVDREKDKYFPVEDYTITLYDEVFTPEKILTLYDETRWKLLESIGTNYEINSVEINDNEATVTFTSRGIASMDLANTINLIKTNIFPDGLAGVTAATNSTDETIKKANDLLNSFLFYICFDREFLDFGYIEPREHTLILEKDDGRWVLTDENFKELRAQLFISEYSADGAEMRSENTFTNKETKEVKSSKNTV